MLIYICCEKELSFTKAVETSTFVLSEMYFSQHMNQGKCFAHSELICKMFSAIHFEEREEKKMFMHLGGDVVISLKDIISIMDIESSNTSSNTRDFLKTAEDEGFIRKISQDEAKSFVLAEKDKKTIIYLSPISSVTLYKRAGFIDDISLK